MAHLVSLGQLDAARGVAERALATINFRCTCSRVVVCYTTGQSLYTQTGNGLGDVHHTPDISDPPRVQGGGGEI